jgi:hypothetical protein
MLRGKIARPTPETVRKLAAAVATDPDTGEVNALKRDEALHELSGAAGYPDIAVDVGADDLVQAIRARVGNLQVADFWAEMVTTYPDLQPPYQQLIRTWLEIYAKRGGGDTVSLLLALSTIDASLPEDLRRWLADPRPRP